MGTRANAQGLDLNRDHMKVDAPETRSLLRMLDAYDPQVLVDLHTTNGTYHAYQLTYAPPLHPGVAPELDALLRDEWLPAVRRGARERNLDFYDYGNVGRGPEGEGWYTFDHRPRFNNNYGGLRNRPALLGEAYAYLPFQERVHATAVFVEEVLGFAHAHADRIRALVRRLDGPDLPGSRLPTRATFRETDPAAEILMGEVDEQPHPFITGHTIRVRVASSTPTRMREFVAFQGTEDERVPREYHIPPDQEEVLERIQAHGIRVGRLVAPQEVEVEVFRVDSVQVAERPFQGHQEHTVFGAWRPETRTVPAGTYVLAMSQPLARLAFYLLEPRSDDGLAAWGFFPAEALRATGYPVTRLR